MDAASKEFLRLYSLLLENRNRKRDPEKERWILKNKDAEDAYLYAKDIIKGRWPKAEEFIKESPGYAYEYAKDIIKGRWPEAEKFIKKSPGYAYDYARRIIKGRWLEAEKFIKKDNRQAYEYAKDVIKGRWPEAEEYIKKDRFWTYCYARDIIKGRWPEAEEFIKKDPEYACEYAKYIIRDRWPEAEEGIYEADHGHWLNYDWLDYLKFLVKLCMKKGRRKDLEELFLKEAEKENGYGVIPYQYAKNVIKGRWIELEKIKINETMYWNKYLKLICKECSGDGVISLGIGGASEECPRCNGGGFDLSKI